MSDVCVVAITGASGGIGAAIALGLAKKGGYSIVLLARRKEELEKVALLCNGCAVAFVADCSIREQVAAAVAFSIQTFGKLDVFINNAGQGCSVRAMQMTDANIDDMMSANVKSAVYGMQEAAKVWKAHNVKGHIINVSSVLGRLPFPTPQAGIRSAYTGAKHFLNAITEVFRDDLAADGITVSLFSPGPVATDFGINASGVDSRHLPGTQDVQEVADVLIEECIVHRRVDVYSRPVYAEWVAKYYSVVSSR